MRESVRDFLFGVLTGSAFMLAVMAGLIVQAIGRNAVALESITLTCPESP